MNTARLHKFLRDSDTTEILCEWLALLDAKPTRDNSENLMHAFLIKLLCVLRPRNATIDDTNKSVNTVTELLAVHNYTHNPTLSAWLSQRTPCHGDSLINIRRRNQ